MGGLMGNSLSIGLADGLPPSPPSIDLQHSLQRKGREYHVSVSNAVDCCVFLFFHRSHRLSLFLCLALCDMNRHAADIRWGLRTTKKWPLRSQALMKD
jgi:hypothetical protein